MVYKEVKPEVWSPEKEGDFIEGTLAKVEENVGVNKSTIYSLEVSDGKFKTIWGSAILDQRMSFVDVGNKVRITYKGLAEKQSGKNPAKIFKVEVDKETE